MLEIKAITGNFNQLSQITLAQPEATDKIELFQQDCTLNLNETIMESQENITGIYKN